MAVYSNFGITIDGQPLDTYAWNIDVKTRPVAGYRTGDVAISGVDGVAASLNDDLESTTVVLSMWALGVSRTGVVPDDPNAVAQVRANIDELTLIFSKTHALMDLREPVNSSGGVRQAFCKRVEAFSPEIRAGGLGRFTVTLLIPSGSWQDVSTPDWSQGTITSGNTYEVTTLAGSTAPIADSVTLFQGPALNPQLTDLASGGYVRLNASLPAGQTWRVNSKTWATRYGAGLTLGSADTAGTDAQAITAYGGGKAPFLRLLPTFASGQRRVFLTVGGAGYTTGTGVSVRATRKFLQ